MTIKAFSSVAAIYALIGSASASADELQLPLTKEGLWESHTQQVIQSKKYETVMKICQTHELEKSMKSVGDSLRKQNQCSEKVTRQSASSYTSESHCDKGPLAGSVTKTTITYQGDTSTHMELHMTNGPSDTVTIVDSRYLGSCPADMKPGDAVSADGTKMSLGPH